MANVRLLRQLVKDYDGRVANVNEQYQDQRSIYEKAVDAYNASVSAAKAGTPYLGEMANAPGTYGLFGGTDSAGNIAYKGGATVIADTSQLGSASTRISHDTWGPSAPMYVRNPDGSATKYTSVGTKVRTGRDTYTTNYSWVPGESIQFLPTTTPTPPEMGDPGRLNLTEKEKGILQNPTLGPSEMNLSTAVGMPGTSSLAGDQPTTSSSAFANPEDPNNLKERGVLARVLGGQL